MNVLNSSGEPTPVPEYMSVLPFEGSFLLTEWKIWFHANWTLSIYFSLVYILAIFSIQMGMKNVEAFSLRRPLILWNLFLAIFSILGTVRSAPELIYTFQTQQSPWYTSTCTRDFHSVTGGFWTLLFAFSKVLELGDTLFIVLRKHPLIFLHWYHHVTVLCYCWLVYTTYDSTSTWFIVINFGVHSIMYSYYALRAIGMRVPKSTTILITSLQLIQMMIGIGINVFALFIVKLEGRHCATDLQHIYVCIAMYTSYFLLFANYFRHTYLKTVKMRTD